MVAGQTYDVVFKEIPNAKTLTGAQINSTVNAFGAVVFGRVEDVDYRKGGTGREVYFTVTGQAATGVNADNSRSTYGRVYRLVLDPADPTRGTLEVVLDGDDRTGPARLFQNPDNIVATPNYLYIEEDPNEYGDETHDSYLWQYNLATKELKVVFEIDHRRGAADFAKFNTVSGTYAPAATSPRGSWENSGMLDVSDVTGKAGTFLVGIQAHGWHAARFKGVDGGALRAAEDQGSELLVLSGLPR
jgi:secreted PhoX family phosphatase